MTALIRAACRALALVAALLVLAGIAHGHAVVLETVPADGAVLQRAPGEVVVRFNEPVGLLTVQVLNADGEAVTPASAGRVDDRDLRIALPPRLPEGSYVASYRVVSIDSHPVGGSVVFSVGQVSSRFTPPPAEPEDGGWMLAMLAVRLALYAGILGGAGGVVFLRLFRPADGAGRATERIAAALAAAGSLAALLAIGIHGGRLLGGPAGSLADASTWGTGLTSSFGATAVAATVGLALVAAGLWRHRPPPVRPLAHVGAGLWLDWPAILRRLPLLGAVIALASFALSGHAVTAGPRWLTVPVLLTHTTAVAYWAGALLPLLYALRVLDKAAAPIVERFSRIAVGAVAALVIAGLIIAVLQVRSFGGLVGTTYGLVLLAKIGLVAGLIALAAANKLRLTPALVRREPGAARALGRIVAAEIALVIAILLATAALGTTPPPRALAGGAESHAAHLQQPERDLGLATTIVSGGRSAEIVLDSELSGINSAEIIVRDGPGWPIEAQEVTLIAANPAAGVEPIRRAADRTQSGAWRVENLLLVPAGRWTLRLDVLVSDFEKAILDTEVELR